MLRSKRLAGLVFFALSVAACAFVWTQIVLDSQNTLYRNGKWLVAKRLKEVAVMGADDFLLSRMSLAGHHLNLGAWYGDQRVVFREAADPTEIHFRFELERGNSFSLLLGENGTGFSALRIWS